MRMEHVYEDRRTKRYRYNVLVYDTFGRRRSQSEDRSRRVSQECMPEGSEENTSSRRQAPAAGSLGGLRADGTWTKASHYTLEAGRGGEEGTLVLCEEGTLITLLPWSTRGLFG